MRVNTTKAGVECSVNYASGSEMYVVPEYSCSFFVLFHRSIASVFVFFLFWIAVDRLVQQKRHVM